MRFWVVGAALVLAGFGIAGSLPAAQAQVVPGQAQVPAAPTKITWNGSSLANWVLPVLDDRDAMAVRSYAAFRATAYNPPKGKNLQIVNLGKGNKAIKIITRRHCTKSWSDELVAGFSRAKGQNEYRSACPKGTITRYSTGRVESPAGMAIPVGGTKLEARVKLPANAVRGVRFAVWATTPAGAVGQMEDTGYCSEANQSTNMLEVDILEWYGGASSRNRAHVGDHVGCDYPVGTLKAHKSVNGGKRWVSKWHTVGVATGGASDKYLIDGKTKFTLTYNGNEATATTWAGSGTSAPSRAVWTASHSPLGRYVLVVQGEVFRSSCSTRFCQPNPKKPFPAQYMLVDWVRATALAGAPVTSPTPSPTPTVTPTPNPSASVTPTPAPSPTPLPDPAD